MSNSRFTALVVLLIACIVAGVVWLRIRPTVPSKAEVIRSAPVDCSAAISAFSRHQSNLWLSITGRVAGVLSDSQGQYRHQRFIVSCASGRTVLVVNDISIGQRVPVTPGDQVSVRGIYIWNPLGGLLHFTHHDPAGGPGGWILYRRHVYALLGPDNVGAEKQVVA